MIVVAILGVLAVCWLSYSVGHQRGRALGRYEGAEAKMLEQGYGLDDRLRDEADDPTELFIADLDRTLNAIEWQRLEARMRRP